MSKTKKSTPSPKFNPPGRALSGNDEPTPQSASSIVLTDFILSQDVTYFEGDPRSMRGPALIRAVITEPGSAAAETAASGDPSAIPAFGRGRSSINRRVGNTH